MYGLIKNLHKTKKSDEINSLYGNVFKSLNDICRRGLILNMFSDSKNGEIGIYTEKSLGPRKNPVYKNNTKNFRYSIGKYKYFWFACT